MSKVTLEFEIPDEQVSAEKAIRVQEVLNNLLYFEDQLRSAERNDTGEIYFMFLSMKEIDKGCTSDDKLMIKAIRESYYRFTEPVRDLINQ